MKRFVNRLLLMVVLGTALGISPAVTSLTTSPALAVGVGLCPDGSQAPDGDKANCSEQQKHPKAPEPVVGTGDSSCSTPILGPGSPGLYDNLCKSGSPAITALSDSLIIVANVIRILLWLSGSLGVVFLIVGGIFYTISAGNPSQLKRAKEIITNVVTGLVMVMVAYAVVTFIAGKF